jgi:hypothetical protein
MPQSGAGLRYLTLQHLQTILFLAFALGRASWKTSSLGWSGTMKLAIGLVGCGIVLALPAAVPADGMLSGKWRLANMSAMGDRESTNWLIQFETKENKTTATLVGSANKGKAELMSFAMTGDRVRIVVKAATEQVFEGLLEKDGKKIAGVFANDKTVAAAYMVPTDVKSIATKAVASKLNVSEGELRAWAESAYHVAKEHGANWPAEINGQLALAFLAGRKHGLAIEHANAAETALNNQSSLEQQVKVLQVVSRVLTDAGKVAELKRVSARLDKLEKGLDEDYVAHLPSFKAPKYGGRKGPSDRVVVMELFTGAQCPDCPPADVASEVLQKTYTPNELVLLEYHTHIPQPDPMTNPDTEARWKYYRDAYGKGVPGVPTSLFNGTPKGGHGGRLPDSENYYQSYRGIIDPLLETPAPCRITASAKRIGDTIRIDAQVAGLKEPGKDKKIRLALVEESIRFLGVNKIRFHHQVVRALPGGAAGVAAMNPTTSVQAAVDIAELRTKLIAYLDNYALTQRPFQQVARPLDLQHLRVIAFLQDDVTHEILQATQVDVVQ